MKILPKNEIYNYTKDNENIHSLLKIADHSIDNGQYDDIEFKNETLMLITKSIGDLNYQHHNDGKFFSKICSVFSINGEPSVIEGQEDVAVIEHNNVGLIFRSAEPGVYLSIRCQRDELKFQEETIAELIKTVNAGFKNEKEFKALMLSYELRNELIDSKNSEHKRNKI